MNDNYLWDRSGEPDPEIQELEEILGALRYQPYSLEIPSSVQVGRRRRLFPALAIAAAVALLAVALGLWFHFNHQQSARSLEAKRDLPADQKLNVPPPTQALPNHQAIEVAGMDKQSIQSQKRHRREPAGNLLGTYKSRGRATTVRQPELTAQELVEKEQVLLALRLVSAKLNVAQRKTLGAPQPNTIRNQHKMG